MFGKREWCCQQRGFVSVEEQLFSLLCSGGTHKEREQDTLHAKIVDIENRIKKYLSLFEKGLAGQAGVSESTRDRLQQPESEVKSLKQSLSLLDSTESDKRVDIKGVGEIIRWFFENFECEFDRLPITGRKQLIRKIVSEIIVDRKRNVANVYVSKLPAVINQLEELSTTNKKALTVHQNQQPVSAMSSGGRT